MYLTALFVIEQSVSSVLKLEKFYPANYRKIVIGKEVIKRYPPAPSTPRISLKLCYSSTFSKYLSVFSRAPSADSNSSASPALCHLAVYRL